MNHNKCVSEVSTGFIIGAGHFLFTAAFRLVVRPIHPSSHWLPGIKCMECKADYLVAYISSV